MIKKWWHFFDGNNQVSAEKNTGISAEMQHEIAAGIALLIAEVLRSSNHFSEAEQQTAKAFFRENFNKLNDSKMIQIIHNHFTVGSRPMLRITCKHLMGLVDEKSVQNILKFLMKVAASDDFIHAREMRCIQRIAQYMNVDETAFSQMKTSFLSKNNPYALLEVPETASLAEVKKAYRMKILKHHPDKRPAWKSEREATNEFRAIQQAFEKILNGYETV